MSWPTAEYEDEFTGEFISDHEAATAGNEFIPVTDTDDAGHDEVPAGGKVPDNIAAVEEYIYNIRIVIENLEKRLDMLLEAIKSLQDLKE